MAAAVEQNGTTDASEEGFEQVERLVGVDPLEVGLYEAHGVQALTDTVPNSAAPSLSSVQEIIPSNHKRMRKKTYCCLEYVFVHHSIACS